MEKLSKAKAAIILDHPFFASLLCRMHMIEDKSIPTLCTNGEYIKYNPDFIDKLDQAEIVFALAHEVMHNVFLHMFRRENRDPKDWNVAGDYVINDMLVKEKVGRLIEGVLHDPNIVAEGNGTTEGVYKIVNQKQDEQEGGEGKPGNGKGEGDPLSGDCEDAPDGNEPGESGTGDDNNKPTESSGNGMTRQQREAQKKIEIIQAVNAAKMAGKMPGSLARMVKELTKTETDWKANLKRFFTERAKLDWTYAKPKRRFLAEDIYLPGLTGESLGEIVVAIDCSGSIDEEQIQKFGNEIRTICEDTKPTKVTVIYFDDGVARVDTFGPDDELTFKGEGGGGTAFSPIFKYIEEKGLNPKACVVLTDLYCDDFGSEPDYPVMWATIAAEKAPFGEVLKIKV